MSCSLTQFGSTKRERKPSLVANSKQRLPELVVIDDDELECSACNVRRMRSKRSQDIDGVEDVVEKDVIERFVKIEFFGVTLKEMQFRMVHLRARDHGVADLGPHSVSRFRAGQVVPGLATQFQNALVGLDNESQKALNTAVKVFVRANPFRTLGRNGFLMTAARLADMFESRGAPVGSVLDFRFGIDHEDCCTPGMDDSNRK